MSLPTNYKDQVLDTTQNVKRKYTMINNGDGTYSFDDETVYSEQGSSFGAGDINATNEEVNTLNENLTADGTPFRFGKDANGKYGYILTEGGADTVIPFSNIEFSNIKETSTYGYQSAPTLTLSLDANKKYLVVLCQVTTENYAIHDICYGYGYNCNISVTNGDITYQFIKANGSEQYKQAEPIMFIIEAHNNCVLTWSSSEVQTGFGVYKLAIAYEFS